MDGIEPHPDQTFTRAQLRRLTCVSAKLLLRAIHAGDLPASTYGGRAFRVRWVDFVRWREATRVEASPTPPTAREQMERRAGENVERQIRREASLGQ